MQLKISEAIMLVAGLRTFLKRACSGEELRNFSCWGIVSSIRLHQMQIV